jgi:predicted enzyme related to lactoylglutathione lyase
MEISIHASYLPQDDPQAAGAFHRDARGLEVRDDVGYQPDTSNALHPPGAEVVQEPIEPPYGVRDCAFGDPAGNLVGIQELP